MAGQTLNCTERNLHHVPLWKGGNHYCSKLDFMVLLRSLSQSDNCKAIKKKEERNKKDWMWCDAEERFFFFVFLFLIHMSSMWIYIFSSFKMFLFLSVLFYICEE